MLILYFLHSLTVQNIVIILVKLATSLLMLLFTSSIRVALQTMGLSDKSYIPYARAVSLLSWFYSLLDDLLCSFSGDLEEEAVSLGSLMEVLDPLLLFIINYINDNPTTA